MKNFISLILFLFFSLTVTSQEYSHVDDKVKQYPKQFLSIEALANRISKDFATDIDKTRASYFWLANNIEYDFAYLDVKISKRLNKEPVTNNLYNNNKYKYAANCLINKKAVCSGYSLLLKYTLENMNIPCEYISGDAKTQAREIGVMRNLTKHAWNAVKLDNKWQFIDATWSTGNEKEKPGIFNFSDEYFLISPEKLILNHLPKDKKWQLLNKKISKADFVYKPLFYEGYFSSGLKLNPKALGVIKCKRSGFITLIFDKIDTKKQYYYSFTKDEYAKPIIFIKKDNKYLVRVKFLTDKRDYLSISTNNLSTIEFKIIPSF